VQLLAPFFLSGWFPGEESQYYLSAFGLLPGRAEKIEVGRIRIRIVTRTIRTYKSTGRVVCQEKKSPKKTGKNNGKKITEEYSREFIAGGVLM
jgi:hypothetical protein